MEEQSSAPRQRISSGTPYEAQVGYSRAVRVGDAVFVSGTTAIQDGTVAGQDDPGAQTRLILEKIEWALAEAGASLAEVVRYRVYLTRTQDWPAVAAELSKVFGAIRPANTLVVIAALVDPAMLVEIEADAIIGSALP